MWTEFVASYPASVTGVKQLYIYIELPEEEAIEYFKKTLKHDPESFSTGYEMDFHINRYDNLREATAYRRGGLPYYPINILAKSSTPIKPLEEFIRQENVLVVYKNQVAH